ncbi:UPF0415 protein C7orf25 homolog [Toxorhynchites rutilus septentrionalis]|uniref:UPF0415 protein C7orf25 homolog n=1 Tax=Toxorhynchites rutilus septentrionalis TaxID=329112 RepID=UPI002479D22B|nr:UPF0415 protein C7orf25 homolog [Toxorhynchites rutilus septentrionalis]
MENEYTLEELARLAQEKISLGEKLLQDLANLMDSVDGVRKISKKISQELKFLHKVKSAKTITINHILCSNLTHFACLVQCLLGCENVTHVDYPLSLEDRGSKLRVDIVADGGATWIKVIARNPKSLSDGVHGRTSYGSKSIVEQAEEYVEAAEANPHLFKPPRVVFRFLSKIDDELVDELERVGVFVLVLQTSQPVPKTETTAISKLNLDITTLIAYVSAMTNGSSHWEYNEPLLTEQAQWEREKPIKPLLDQLFHGKELICCETAVSSFKEILSILGGVKEKVRAEELFSRVTVLPDVPLPEEMRHIRVGGKIKPRSLQVFAFGLIHEAITVTSNEGFVRAARMQGLEVPVFVHDARALTEEKEKSAKLLEE